MHTYAPPEDLADVVTSLWSARWDLRGQPPHTTKLLGDPSVHFVFEAGGRHAGSRLVGVWTRLWTRVLEDRGRVRGIKLRAGAIRAFVDAPAAQFTNRIVPLADVFASPIKALESSVLGPEEEDLGFSECIDWLRTARRLDEHEPVASAVNIVNRIAADREITTVARLCQAANLGPRALQRLFRQYVGAPPKWVIRRQRLQEIALQIEKGHGSLAKLAAELGYTDQAHLTRDFKSAVGKTPREFAAGL